MNKLSTLVVSGTFSPDIGGSELSIHTACKGLIKRGHNVIVIADDRRPEYYLIEDVPVYGVLPEEVRNIMEKLEKRYKFDVIITQLIYSPEALKWGKETKIQNPEQAIAYGKNNIISQIYTENWVNLNDFDRLKELFTKESQKFLYYFEIFLSCLVRDDEYRAYMNYTIAFYKLVGLKAMVEDEYYNLYQPSRFTTRIIDNWELRVKYYQASAGLRKYDMIDQRDNLKNLFLEVLKKGMDKFHMGRVIFSDIQKFFKKIDKKYLPFKNLRDISLIPNHFSNGRKIKESLIYRSASLSKNKSELILKFLKENKIKYILDIRHNDELENYIKYNNFKNNDIILLSQKLVNSLISFLKDLNNSCFWSRSRFSFPLNLSVNLFLISLNIGYIFLGLTPLSDFKIKKELDNFSSIIKKFSFSISITLASSSSNLPATDCKANIKCDNIE